MFAEIALIASRTSRSCSLTGMVEANRLNGTSETRSRCLHALQ